MALTLIVGAGGHLGACVARRLLAQGRRGRASARRPEKLGELRRAGAEVVCADLRHQESLAAACAGVQKVFAAAHSFLGIGTRAPRNVDGTGNLNLIQAARRAGVRHFVFTSVEGARADHPIDLFRIKFEVEEALRASGLACTILRPEAFMETWAELVGGPVWRRGWTVVVGRGQTPLNLVAVEDVARVATWALEDPAAQNRILTVQGPHAWTLNAVALLFACVAGRSHARVVHVPLGLALAVVWLARPLVPDLSRRLAACLRQQELPVDSCASLDSVAHQTLGPAPQITLDAWARRRFRVLQEPERLAVGALPVGVLNRDRSERHGAL